jgi:hypothetical protein
LSQEGAESIDKHAPALILRERYSRPTLDDLYAQQKPTVEAVAVEGSCAGTCSSEDGINASVVPPVAPLSGRKKMEVLGWASARLNSFTFSGEESVLEEEHENVPDEISDDGYSEDEWEMDASQEESAFHAPFETHDMLLDLAISARAKCVKVIGSYSAVDDMLVLLSDAADGSTDALRSLNDQVPPQSGHSFHDLLSHSDALFA